MIDEIWIKENIQGYFGLASMFITYRHNILRDFESYKIASIDSCMTAKFLIDL